KLRGRLPCWRGGAGRSRTDAGTPGRLRGLPAARGSTSAGGRRAAAGGRGTRAVQGLEVANHDGGHCLVADTRSGAIGSDSEPAAREGSGPLETTHSISAYRAGSAGDSLRRAWSLEPLPE